MRNRPTVTQMFPLIRVVHVLGFCNSDIGIGSRVTKMLVVSRTDDAAQINKLRKLQASAIIWRLEDVGAYICDSQGYQQRLDEPFLDVRTVRQAALDGREQREGDEREQEEACRSAEILERTGRKGRSSFTRPCLSAAAATHSFPDRQ